MISFDDLLDGPFENEELERRVNEFVEEESKSIDE